MKISYRIPIYQYGGESGIRYLRNDPDEWRRLVFSPYRQHILDLLKKYGEANDYGYWLNDMLGRHAKLYKAAEASGDWKSVAYRSNDVGKYQLDYRGGIDNNGTYKRYGSVVINPEDRYNFNETGIRNAQNNNRYDFFGPSKRLESDRGNSKYLIDNLYSGITDDRRLLGRKGDWDESSDDYKLWQKELNNAGWETFLDTDNYYKLRRLNSVTEQPIEELSPEQQADPNGKIRAFKTNWDGINWNKIGEGLGKLLNSPDLWGTARLAGNIANNDRVYDEALKAVKPTLILPYLTHRQVVGDEATKQAYYRRAVAGQTKASRPFTSDADRLMAYMQEARRVGDELRAQGDLADNQEIRRTSDESNQHQWANTQRRTEVANRNLEALNQANALKHNLLALKHSAQWSSIDNYLKSIEYRKRLQLERDNAIQDLIWALTEQNNLENNETYLNLQKAASDAWDKAEKAGVANPMTDPEVQRTTRALKNWQSQYRIRMLQNRPSNKTSIFSLFGKSGMKITHKKKEDLLYKSARDVVEHFRKMSKMSSDSYNRRTPKIEKLAEHPKGTKKYQLGGLAPFTIYTPVALGGETSTTSELGSFTSSSKSSKDDSAKDTLEFVKSLFKEMLGKGLPIDVNTVYSNMTNLFRRYKAFGNEMDTDDIALMYLLSARLLNSIIHSKEVFSKAKELVTQKGGLDEFAVTSGGLYVVQDKEGKIGYADNLSEIKEKGLNPLTNALLLYLRQTSPQLLLEKGDYVAENIISNGIGINKIGEMIKSLAGHIGSSTEKIEGISEVESNKIKAGLQILAGTPDGLYKVTKSSKLSLEQVQAALAFIKNSLSPSQQAILNIHGGTDLIKAFLSSQVDTSSELSISPITGRAAKGDGTTNGGDNDMIPAVAFFNGLGEKDTFIILDKTSDGLKINTISTSITKEGHNTGTISFDKLESSDFGGLLIMNLATMGDNLISSVGRNNIIIDSRIYQAELPIDKEAKASGIIKPDLKFLKRIEVADAKLKQMGIDKSDPKNIPTINKVYQENNLPILYTINNNKPTITSDYARFAIVNGVGTEDAFSEDPDFNDGVLEISDGKERDQFEALMQLQEGRLKYKLNNGYGIGPISWGETKLYKGTIYIPMVTSNISALAGTGYKAKGEEYNLIEKRLQEADAARELGFNPAGNDLKLK